jgi:glycosyltransferase involved in cell wall biosynthesis
MAARSGTSRREVDVLVVCASSTTGHRRNEALVTAALRGLGLEVAEARTDYRLVDPLRRGQPLIDLAEAAALSAATRRALRAVRTRSILYPTSLSAILEPAWRLRKGAIRFDALAVENRAGRRNLTQRRLERRSLALARALVPTSLLPARAGLGTPPGATVVPLPPPIDSSGDPAARRRPAVVCYGADAHKKGLDLIVRAWEQSRPPTGRRLLVTGLDEEAGRRFLRRSGIQEPPGISWLGPVPADRFRRLTATADVYLAASRFEDFGMAQLEALADGAMLVTTPSPGPFEALPLARQLQPGLVATSASPDELATALRRAWAMTEEQRQSYRARARELLAGYSSASLAARLRTQLLPALFGGA